MPGRCRRCECRLGAVAIAFGAAGFIGAIATGHIVRCGVLACDKGIVIRNPTLTARFAWHEVDRVAVVEPGVDEFC